MTKPELTPTEAVKYLNELGSHMCDLAICFRETGNAGMHDNLTNQSVTANMGAETLAWLIEAIREADSLTELWHLIGPSETENLEAEWRLGKLDDLSPLCAWGKQECQLTNEESLARGRYKSIMNVQDAFERKYC